MVGTAPPISDQEVIRREEKSGRKEVKQKASPPPPAPEKKKKVENLRSSFPGAKGQQQANGSVEAKPASSDLSPQAAVRSRTFKQRARYATTFKNTSLIAVTDRSSSVQLARLRFARPAARLREATPVSAVPGPPSCSQDGIVSWWCRETRWFEMSYVVKLNKAAW